MKTKENSVEEQQAGTRLLLWVLAVLAGALVLGSLAAPPVFNFLIALGRRHEALVYLRDLEFERVVSRSVLVAAIFLVVMTSRWSGLSSLGDFGFVRRKGWLKRVGRGFLLGSGSIAVLLLFGWAAGAYAFRSGAGEALLRGVLLYLAGALLVGFIEEGFFRGMIFGAFRRSYGIAGGAILASVVFSLAHFIQPDLPYGVVYGHWYSGLEMFPHLFNKLDFSIHSFPFCLTLFAMGLVLCSFYVRERDVYFIAGLHAGWVWVIRMGVDLFVKTPGRMMHLYGYSSLISKSYVALYAIIAFLIVVLLLPRKGPSGE